VQSQRCRQHVTSDTCNQQLTCSVWQGLPRLYQLRFWWRRGWCELPRCTADTGPSRHVLTCCDKHTTQCSLLLLSPTLSAVKYNAELVPWYRWPFGLVGNVVGRIHKVNQRRAQLVLGWVTVFKTGKPSLYVTSYPGQLSLAIPPRVGKKSTGDDYGHHQGRNGEFCVTVGPVTRTADILTQSVIWWTWAVC